MASGAATVAPTMLAVPTSPERTSSRSTDWPSASRILAFKFRVEVPIERSVTVSAEVTARLRRSGERNGSWIISKL